MEEKDKEAAVATSKAVKIKQGSILVLFLSFPSEKQEERPLLKKRGGRAKDQSNYSSNDVEKLLELVESILPATESQWEKVGESFQNWCSVSKRPYRPLSSLKSKYDSIFSNQFIGQDFGN